MLNPIPIPGLFVTGTDTGVGKTLIAGAIAQWFARHGAAVAVRKPMATGCERRRPRRMGAGGRSAGGEVAGVVSNRYPGEHAEVAEETTPAAIERWGGVRVLCIAPEEPKTGRASVPVDVAAAVDTVDWARLASRRM